MSSPTAMTPAPLRIAWVEEWMSTLAREVLPDLARRHEVTYLTAGDAIPQAAFRRVVRARRWRYMNVAGFELSHRVNSLYRSGLIDLALVWSSIGFCLRKVPFVHLVGGSVYAQILLCGAERPLYKRLKFLPGFLHYAVPEMLCNRHASSVVVPSQTLKRDLVRLHGLAEETVIVVPHGVEERHLTLYGRKPLRTPAKILSVGRLHSGKGIGAIAEEFFRRPDIDAEFLIVGDGPDRARVENTAARDGRVKMLGSVDRADLESILVTTNIFVFPTFYEGFGLALLEAMASGHACVCYDIPAVRELLDDSGVCVPAGDAAALVQAVADLVEQPERRAALAVKAHERAQHFSWAAASAALDRIIRETVKSYGTTTNTSAPPPTPHAFTPRTRT